METQFNIALARQRRDEAIARALDGKDEWRAAAKWALFTIAKTQEEFTADDLWATGLPPCPGDNRAIGPIIMAATKAGLIERTDRTRQTSRFTNHARPLTIWKSKVYERATT